VSLWKALRLVGLPLVLNFVWVGLVLLYVPALQGASPGVMWLYVPDMALLLTVSAALAAFWGTTQAGSRLCGLLRPRVAPHPVDERGRML
jgi:hypothetical protein